MQPDIAEIVKSKMAMETSTSRGGRPQSGEKSPTSSSLIIPPSSSPTSPPPPPPSAPMATSASRLSPLGSHTTQNRNATINTITQHIPQGSSQALLPDCFSLVDREVQNKIKVYSRLKKMLTAAV